MSPRAAQRVNWFALITAFAAATAVAAHLLWVGAEFESKADAATVGDHEARLRVVEIGQERVIRWQATADTKLDTLLVRTSR